MAQIETFCRCCGAKFTASRRSQIFCSKECRTRYHQSGVKSPANINTKKKAEKKKELTKAQKQKRFTDEVVKAKELGMSYGQYKALKYIEEHRPDLFAK